MTLSKHRRTRKRQRFTTKAGRCVLLKYEDASRLSQNVLEAEGLFMEGALKPSSESALEALGLGF